jgi:hypothetical protein
MTPARRTSIAFVLTVALFLCSQAPTHSGTGEAHRLSLEAQGNPSISKDLATVIVSALVLALVTVSPDDINGSTATITNPITIPGSIAIPTNRSILVFGKTNISGPLTFPSFHRPDALRDDGNQGAMVLSRGISGTGPINIPHISYGPIDAKYGSLLDQGPFVFDQLMIPGPITVPGGNLAETKISGPVISGKIQISGTIGVHKGKEGGITILISGPITFEGPITFASLSYGPNTNDVWGALKNPGPLKVSGPIKIGGPVLIEGPIRRR